MSANRLAAAILLSLAGHGLVIFGADWFLSPPEQPEISASLTLGLIASKKPPESRVEDGSPEEAEPTAEVPGDVPEPEAVAQTAPEPGATPVKKTPADPPVESHPSRTDGDETGTPPGEADAPAHLSGPASIDFKSLAAGRSLPLPSYPALAQRWAYEGTVRVQLFVAADGRLESVEMMESSGHSILDDEVLETIRRSWSFPPPGREVVSVKSFTFRL